MNRTLLRLPSRSPLFRGAVLVLLAALVPRPATAVPVVDLSWDACSPIVTSKQPIPGQSVSVLYASVTGMTDPHRGYVVHLWFAGSMPCRSSTSTPDAWRFDPAGCQAGYGQIVLTPSKTCPRLSGTATILSILGFDDPDDGIAPPGAMRAHIAVSYPNEIQTPDPGVRYQLFRIEFDHAYSVVGPGMPGETCGGFENPVCLALWRGTDTSQGECWLGRYTDLSYIRADGVYLPMSLGQGYATFGLTPGSAMSCFEVTPAHAKTWGEVKSRYRQ